MYFRLNVFTQSWFLTSYILLEQQQQKRCVRKSHKKVLSFKNCDLSERDKLGWKSILRCFSGKSFLKAQTSLRYRSACSNLTRSIIFFLNSAESICPHRESTDMHGTCSHTSANIYIGKNREQLSGSEKLLSWGEGTIAEKVNLKYNENSVC